jgi:hypothetical protein
LLGHPPDVDPDRRRETDMTMRTTELDSAGGAGHGLREDCCGERGMAARSMADLMLSNLRMPGVPDLLDGGAGEDRSVRQRDAVDLLVVGSVATGDPGQPVAGAMGVKDGRVVALGSADELQGLRGTDTELIPDPEPVVLAPEGSQRGRYGSRVVR